MKKIPNHKIKNKKTKIINIYGKYNNEKILIIILLLIFLNKNNKKILIIDFNKNIPKEYFYYINKNKLRKNNKKENTLKKEVEELEKIKLNNNIELININKVIFNKNNKYFLNKLFFQNKNNYNYIIINTNYKLNKHIKEWIFKNSDINNLIFIRKILGIKELQKIFYYQKKYLKKCQNSLHIVKNKHDLFSIDSRILKKIVYKNTKIINLKYKKIYKCLKNNFYKIKINKKIEKTIQEILC